MNARVPIEKPIADWTAMPANSGALGEYLVDATQRTVLFWDLLRRRSEQYYEQKAKAIPSALNFKAELVLDARSFAKPVNYLLYRIVPPAGVDERAFNQLVQMRAGYGDISLEEFKCAVRDQYFMLLLDEEAAVEAIPSMLPADKASRKKLLKDIHRIVGAAGDLDEKQLSRLTRIEELFA